MLKDCHTPKVPTRELYDRISVSVNDSNNMDGLIGWKCRSCRASAEQSNSQRTAKKRTRSNTDPITIDDSPPSRSQRLGNSHRMESHRIPSSAHSSLLSRRPESPEVIIIDDDDEVVSRGQKKPLYIEVLSDSDDELVDATPPPRSDVSSRSVSASTTRDSRSIDVTSSPTYLSVDRDTPMDIDRPPSGTQGVSRPPARRRPVLRLDIAPTLILDRVNASHDYDIWDRVEMRNRAKVTRRYKPAATRKSEHDPMVFSITDWIRSH